MFMFNRQSWNENKKRFAESYKKICPVVRSVGYEEMTDHRILTDDRSVQQTVFANDTKVTVNFGNKTWHADDGGTVEPMGFAVTGQRRRD
jgi:hypothetical protein